MKVRTVEIGKDKKMGVVWCMGCGAFHGFDSALWNGDEDNPSTKEAIVNRRGDNTVCIFVITEGKITWDVISTHRLAAKSRDLPHEGSWRVHSPDQVKQPTKPPEQTAPSGSPSE